MKQLIEAALFSAAKGLDLDTLRKAAGVKKKEAECAIDTLKEDYVKIGSCLEIHMIDGKYLMRVKPEHAKEVRGLFSPEFPRPIMRTLSVISFNEPVPQSQVVDIRGNKAYDHVKELERRGLIKREPQGRTKMITTTDLFKEYFV